MNDNPYLDDNFVPYNKFFITNAAVLRLAEYNITSRAMRGIFDGTTPLSQRPASYGFEYLRAINKHLFDPVYEWAGQTRTIPISKTMSNGMKSVFAHPDSFAQKFQDLEQKTAAFVTAKGWTHVQKIDALVKIFASANHIHPFPEGNGRTLQVFMRQLAREQGIVLDYTRTSATEWNWASAVSGVYGQASKDAEGRNRLHQQPRDLKPITWIFATMAKPERAPEPFAGVIDRTRQLLRNVIFDDNRSDHPKAADKPMDGPENRPEI
jgi:cell filamentation protein